MRLGGNAMSYTKSYEGYSDPDEKRAAGIKDLTEWLGKDKVTIIDDWVKDSIKSNHNPEDIATHVRYALALSGVSGWPVSAYLEDRGLPNV
jgi:hypothetical protein